MHRLAAPALLLALLLTAACSDEVICTAIGTPVGVSVNVKAPLAARAESAEMEVCWDGSCERTRADLYPSTRPGTQTCSGDSCGVSAVPTADKHGFGDVQGLPKRQVQVRLTLRDAGSEPILERTVAVTPKGRFPNGPRCGEGGPNAVLTVEADGTLRESAD
ncbi:hypothetical protein GCM10022224_085460 [Nonomuraea antimicrobica]|uniref:Uncharacterized protein n=1 Tax=Nonomuraea antimicrobica TaxID=561173 RepID=A0ABP7DKG3_9ACTN